MGLFDKLKAAFSSKEDVQGECGGHELDHCDPEEFDDYSEVDSTKVDSLEGAPK